MRSVFFSEEKNQKTFISCPRGTIRDLAGIVLRAAGHKSFLLLFSKKEGLACLPWAGA